MTNLQLDKTKYFDPINKINNHFILDIIMPTMNGFTFYKRIKEIDTEIKACFLTASEPTQQEFEKGIFPIMLKDEMLLRKPIRHQTTVALGIEHESRQYPRNRG